MLQDELSGVGFVLTVVHVHLEFISLEEEKNRLLSLMMFVKIDSNQEINKCLLPTSLTCQIFDLQYVTNFLFYTRYKCWGTNDTYPCDKTMPNVLW